MEVNIKEWKIVCYENKIIFTYNIFYFYLKLKKL